VVATLAIPAAAGLASAPARAQGSNVVTVYADGNLQPTSLGTEDVHDHYPVRGAAGTDPFDTFVNGWSIRQILTQVSAQTVDVVGDARTFTLSSDELNDPAAHFVNGLQPAVSDGGATVRPIHLDHPDDDVNGGTQIAQGVMLYAHSGGSLDASLPIPVSGSADGLTVHFTVDISGACDQPRYAWDFGDGHASTLENPTHAYASANSYVVVADVECGAGNGRALTNRFAVGAGPAATPGPGTTATPQPSATPVATATATPRPRKTATPTPTPRSGGSGGGGKKTGTGTGGAAATATPTPAATVAPAVTATATVTPEPATTPAPSAAPPSAGPSPTAEPERLRAGADSGLPVVRGRLVSAIVPVSAAELAAAAAPAPAVAPSGGGATPPAPRAALPLGLLAVAALLLAGAWRERRTL
jgi:hypothetical protein